MTSTGKKILGLVAVSAALVGILLVWHFLHPPTPVVPGTGPRDPIATQNVGDFDQFQQDLASRVLKQFGGENSSDFSVIVATTAYPLGTLLRESGSVPADLEDCVPSPLPKPYAAQHLFPSYTMSSDTAIAANLGSKALQGLDSAGVNLQQAQSVQYTIADAEIQIMDDKSVDTVTGQGNCGSYLVAHPGMRLIRGVVLGKMTFTVKVSNPASVKAQLSRLGGFSITDNPGASTLSVSDVESQPIVIMLSEFRQQAATAHPVPRPTAVEAAVLARVHPPIAAGPPPPAPPPDTAPAHMYVQMDTQDNPASGARVVQLLKSGWPAANVESQVQRIPTQKMPNTAQVRYFNEADVELANRCAGILKGVYPNIRVVRIGLTSPKGQLEVWLPKVGN